MSYDYTNTVRVALDQIAKFGRSVTLRYVSLGTYDPSTGTTSGGTNSDSTVKAVISDYSKNQIDGDSIRRGDKKMLLAASGLSSAPNTNDFVIDTDTYKVVSVDTIQPGDSPILYVLQLRK